MTAMKIILLTDVKKVGVRGAVATVADGYANNVLIPGKLAILATSENLKRWERERVGEKEHAAVNATMAQKALSDIDGKSISLQARANPSGGLFEAVRAKQITEAIHKQLGASIPEEAITLLPEAIKKLGEYRAEIKVHDASAELVVVVSKL
jgi:large subunit ribosomal protein L9